LIVTKKVERKKGGGELAAVAMSSSNLIPAASLESYAPASADPPPPPPLQGRSPTFPIAPSLNAKLHLHTGPAFVIGADALLLATNESFTERGGVVGEVWKKLGKELEDEVRKAEKVRGERRRVGRAKRAQTRRSWRSLLLGERSEHGIKEGGRLGSAAGRWGSLPVVGARCRSLGPAAGRWGPLPVVGSAAGRRGPLPVVGVRCTVVGCRCR
jgi:hypothetical protein